MMFYNLKIIDEVSKKEFIKKVVELIAKLQATGYRFEIKYDTVVTRVFNIHYIAYINIYKPLD